MCWMRSHVCPQLENGCFTLLKKIKRHVYVWRQSQLHETVLRNAGLGYMTVFDIKVSEVLLYFVQV